MNLNTVTLSSVSTGLVNLGSYYKKPIVIFNSASLCSYTSQLKDFQTLYETGKIIPMAMPTNEFGQQEPGNQIEIVQHYNTKFGVKFVVLDKTTLDHEFFTKFGNPDWNFNKYLFDVRHNFVQKFDAGFKPMDLINHV